MTAANRHDANNGHQTNRTETTTETINKTRPMLTETFTAIISKTKEENETLLPFNIPSFTVTLKGYNQQ